MKQLSVEWSAIREHLQSISGMDDAALDSLAAYNEKDEKGVHFYVIQYEPGEIIMAKGTTSDYAAVHLQGRIHVRDQAPPTHLSGSGCWQDPAARRLQNLVIRQAATWPEGKRPGRGLLGWLAPMYRRFPGLPLRLVDLCESWLPAAAERMRRHVARTLYDRLPTARRFERELSRPGAAQAMAPGSKAAAPDRPITIRTTNKDTGQEELKPLEDRFMGITGTMWNQPRSVTLVADNDPDDGGKPCVMLLIKRKALEIIKKKNETFYKKKMAEFVRTTLPDILAKNRLFRDRLFVEDVLDWDALLRALQTPSGKAGALDKTRERLAAMIPWLPKATAATLDAAEKAEILKGLNKTTARHDLTDAQPSATSTDPETAELLRRRGELNDAELVRLNRLLLESALPGVLAKSARPFPLSRAEFQDFTQELLALHEKKLPGQPFEPLRLPSDEEKGASRRVTVFKQGDDAKSLFLILSGMVRVQLGLSGGQSMVNNLVAEGFFGLAAVLEDLPEGQFPKRTAGVETLCSTTLLELNRDVLREMFAGKYRALGEKLQREQRRFSVRDEQMKAGRLLPPQEPPQALADSLMLTRNLLLIDMDKCTRCDQCVRGCAEAHDGLPRFHRANPKYRFGKWEAAGACMHCLDAPCQEVCPVGAITWLENKAVQIHRDRCIGCSRCFEECPFDVIDMMERLTDDDAPSTAITKKKSGAKTKEPIVATKCDLCLTDDYDPPCVACCPYDAAQRVDPLEFFPDLKNWANLAERR